MKWKVPEIWKNGDVWILGGGPSVTSVFNIPKEVVDRVRNKQAHPSTYSPYMKAIHDKHVIGINVAYQIGDWIDMVFFGDTNFYRVHSHKMASASSIIVSSCNSVERMTWIKYLSRDPKKKQGISDNPHCIAWNNNSGAAAISVAANAGAKRIILLGFDMNLAEDDTQHWHPVYMPGGKRKPKLPFQKHLAGFPAIARDAKARGIEILNCSPISKIKEFPIVTLEEVL